MDYMNYELNEHEVKDMSWKSVIGGVAGFMVGGPVGAAAGAAIGAGLDGLDDDVQSDVSGIPKLEAKLTYVSDEDGTFLELSVPTVPDHACLAVHARENDGDGYIKSNVRDFADGDGDFVRFLDVKTGKAYFYLPKGIIDPDYSSNVTLSFRAIIIRENEDPIILGEHRFYFEHPSGKYADIHLWRPLVYLCMYVAHADGHLDRSEVAEIKRLLLEELEIPKSESKLIKEMMRSYQKASIEECVNQIFLRFPNGDSDEFMRCLAKIAIADNEIHPNEVEVIRQAYIAFGYHADGWEKAKESLGLEQQTIVREETSLDAHRALLGVSEDATKSQIQRAFRQKAAEYHPDKYHNLPQEFQNVAKEMMQKLSEAKAALLAAV